jgi:pimeloyl-ACP methyl ester carboxylesterase
VLIHGAGSGPEVFDAWPEHFPTIRVAAVDLHEGLDTPRASMHDYADQLVRATGGLPTPLALCGWSMGGLVALMAAGILDPTAVVLLEPSPPAEAQGFHPEIEPRDGTFDPQVVYGAFPPGARARPESLRARTERKRGISVPTLACPSLVVCGDDYPADRGHAVADLYEAELLEFHGLDHWDLVRDPRVREEVARFLRLL